MFTLNRDELLVEIEQKGYYVQSCLSPHQCHQILKNIELSNSRRTHTGNLIP